MINKLTYKTYFWLLASFTAILRFMVVGRIGLGDDEAHYFAFSRHPQLSYFDHPPLIGYLIKFFTYIFGVNEFAVRFPAVVLFFLTSIIIYYLAKDMFDEKTAFYSVLLLNVTPVFSLFWRLIKGSSSNYLYLIGVVLGFGLLSKYNMILLLPSTLLFIILSKKYFEILKKTEVYISLLIAFLIFIPVVIWNLQNSFASFGYQLAHGFGKAAPKFSIELLGKCLGAQAGYISPFLFFVYWFVLAVAGIEAYKYFVGNYIKNEESSETTFKYAFLFSFSFPTLFLFNAIASFNEILPHWPATGYLVLAIAVVHFTLNNWHRAWFRKISYFSWGFGLFLTALVPLQAVYKVLPPELFLKHDEAFRVEDGIIKAEKVDVTNDIYGWDIVGKKVKEIADANAASNPFIFTFRHYLSSQLTFYVPQNPRIYCFSGRIDAYGFWQRDISELKGRDAIFLCNSNFYLDPTTVYPFKTWKKLEPVEIFRHGRKVRIFWLWYGTGFAPEKLDKIYTSAILPPYIPLKQAITQLDHNVFWIINKGLRSKLLDYPMLFMTTIGNGLPLALITGFILWYYRRESFMKEFIIGVLIVFIGSLIVHSFKEVFARVRPLTLWGDQVHVLGEKLYRVSFPSGHTQASFSAAVFLNTRFKRYGWLFFIFAILVGISRVYVGAHFPIDVLGGGLIGLLSAFVLVKLLKYRKILD
jgi:membrane-associated phospholipid phosphatase